MHKHVYNPNIVIPAAADNRNKNVIFEICAPCRNCISEINNTQYSGFHSKTSGRLWQYYRDEPALRNNGNIIDFCNDNNNSISFKFKQKIPGQTGNDGTKDVEIMVPLKHRSKFRRTFEVPLINCEISLMLTCSKNYFLVAGTAVNQEPTFTVTDIKLYVPVVTLTTQDNVKLLKQLESGFKRTINWNKYQSKITEQT